LNQTIGPATGWLLTVSYISTHQANSKTQEI